MALHRSLVSIIAKKNPSIWEEIIGPLGPLRRFEAVGLNPQPLPPVARAGLNPQPLPPGVEYGAAVGVEIVRAAGLAQLLRMPFELTVDDICPPRREWPPIPYPPVPWSPRDDDFDLGYAIGLAYALESTVHGWERLDGAGALEALHEAAFEMAGHRG